ncbi:hypothetical protein GQ457_02G015650 [Hibiscus cannabinus]
MVDGVLTRHQAALAAQTMLEGNTVLTQVPEWQHEVNRLQTEMNGMESRPGKKIDDNFQEMRASLMVALHKLLEIGLGKKISTESIPSPQDGLLGSQPITQGSSSGVPTQGNVNPTTKTPVIVVEDDGQRETQMGNQIQTNNFAYKLLCPRFDGDDFRGWISKLDQYFEAENVPENAKVRVVMLHLEKNALQWHQFLAKTQRDLNGMAWEDYLKLLRERFAPRGFSDPFSELLALKQSESVEQYYEEFINLLNQVQFLDNYVLSMFKNHLRVEISQYLELLQPQSLIDAFHMAKRVEGMLYPVQKRSTWSAVKSSPLASLYVPSRAGNSGFKNNYNVGTIPIGQRNMGGGGQKGPGKTISSAEIEERRKGLCFWCAAKYTPGHKCTKTQLFQIMVDRLEDKGEQEEFMDCEEHGKPVFVDGSSTHNYISWNVVKMLGLEMERKNRLKVTVADGNSLDTMGIWRVDSILGKVANLLKEFQDIFAEPTGLPPKRGQDHIISLVDEKTMIKVKPYRYPTWQKDEIEKMIKEMLDSGVIRDSNNNFSSPIVMVKKKDNSWRMCIDYRRLNQVTIKDKFPMPVIEELLDELGRVRVFSKLDLRVFKGQLRKTVLVFFDDILVYSSDLDSHLLHLREVMEILRAHKLYARLSKCSFRAEEIDYLGYVISQGVFRMDNGKVSSIMEWPTPITIKDLRGFLDLYGYYRRFIQGYGIIAQPLTNLLKKDWWKWGSEEASAFQNLKEAVSTAPVLALPDFDEEFSVETDACEMGIGVVLTQRGKPLAFFSKALGNKHQKLYVYEKEMLAALMVVKKWSQYLVGRHFKIKTDHQSLRFLTENQAVTPAQQKWIAKMMGFDYEVIYKKGINNVVADSISRRPAGVSCFEMNVSSVSNDTFAKVTKTWQQDPKLKKIIKELEEVKRIQGKYSWNGKQLRRKGKLVCGWGIFRDDSGAWFSGFTRRIGRCSVLLTELWAVHDELRHAWELEFRNFVLETDNKEVANICNGSSHTLARSILVSAIHELWRRDWEICILHVSRERNEVADRLAYLDRQTLGGEVFAAPPSALVDLVDLEQRRWQERSLTTSSHCLRVDPDE